LTQTSEPITLCFVHR